LRYSITSIITDTKLVIMRDCFNTLTTLFFLYFEKIVRGTLSGSL
jgi:hypothetical protein